MLIQSSLSDVFRYTQLRPPIEKTRSLDVRLQGDTTLAQSIMNAPSAEERVRLANEALSNRKTTFHALEEISSRQKYLKFFEKARNTPGLTYEIFAELLEDLKSVVEDKEFQRDYPKLSDTLLAAVFATTNIPRQLADFQDFFRLWYLLKLQAAGNDPQVSFPEFALAPILLPFDTNSLAQESLSDSGADRQLSVSPQDSADEDEFLDFMEAYQELLQLDRLGMYVQPNQNGLPPEGKTVFTLNEVGRKRLSTNTQKVLEHLAIDLDQVRIEHIISLLFSQITLAPRKVKTSLTPPQRIQLHFGEVRALPQRAVRPSGVADLLVVKQQIKRYEAAEIAHVENVMAGETRSRTHRQLERTEETIITEIETIQEQEHELETAERFELNRETSRTIKQDQQIGFGLTVSGKYGPTVEFSSNFQLNTQKSVEEMNRLATTYAKDVVERSLERISERVREERIRRIIRETEETNLHQLRNETAEHFIGMYQFLDKVYEAQVFNYGIRQMFDFMIPEPAQYLWFLEGRPDFEVKLPDPPKPLEAEPDRLTSALDINESNYARIAARYQANDITPPPDPFLTTSNGVSDAGDEDGRPRNTAKVELTIPAGYLVSRADIIIAALTDDQPSVSITIGDRNIFWNHDDPGVTPEGIADGKHNVYWQVLHTYFPTVSNVIVLAEENKLVAYVLTWETKTYTISINVTCQRSQAKFAQWQIETYKKIQTAYTDRLREHNERIVELTAEAEARAAQENPQPFGAPPSENEQAVRNELKKHCISVITKQRYELFDAVKDNGAYFDFEEAEQEGSFIRFFEQAFEWEQMQFVLYPYFWANRNIWQARFTRVDNDPKFQEFLRAGAARVVLPVRPGFETAIMHYIETGNLWDGLGDPPEISSPLYVSIVQEIKERTAAPLGEVKVGEPWEVRIPTSLVRLRPDNSLPQWVEDPPNSWQWRTR